MTNILNKIKMARIKNRAEESLYYEAVAQEISEGKRIDHLWLQAFSEANGDEAKTKARYISLRVRMLKDLVEFKKEEHKEQKNTERELPQNKQEKKEGAEDKSTMWTALVIIGIIIALFLLFGFLSENSEELFKNVGATSSPSVTKPLDTMLPTVRIKDIEAFGVPGAKSIDTMLPTREPGELRSKWLSEGIEVKNPKSAPAKDNEKDFLSEGIDVKDPLPSSEKKRK